jgi:hypothetical protein
MPTSNRTSGRWPPTITQRFVATAGQSAIKLHALMGLPGIEAGVLCASAPVQIVRFEQATYAIQDTPAMIAEH